MPKTAPRQPLPTIVWIIALIGFSVTVGSGVVGPAPGGALAAINPRLPLLAYGAAVAVAAVLAFFLLRGSRDIKVEPAP